jgi:ribonuclease P protein component
VLFRSNQTGNCRLGFAISRQKVRLAVGRNRLRRLVRESFRRHRGELPPVDLVILARDVAATAANAELTASIEKHWSNVVKAGNRPPTPSRGTHA